MIVVIGIARQTSIDSLRTTGKRVGEERSAGPDYDRVHRRVVSLHDLLGTRIDVRATFLRPPRSFPPFCTPCRELSTPDLFKLRALHGNALNRDPGGGCLRDGYRFCRERERERDPVFREWMCNNSSLRLQGKITGKI